MTVINRYTNTTKNGMAATKKCYRHVCRHVVKQGFSSARNKNNLKEYSNFIFVPCIKSIKTLFYDKWVSVTTAWDFLRLLMEKRPAVRRVAVDMLNNQLRTVDNVLSSSLVFGRDTESSSPQKRILYAFFWVITRLLEFICRLFGTLCLFHFHRYLPAYEDRTDRVFRNVGI